MTDDNRWTAAEVAPLAICPDCNADVTIDEVEPDVFNAVVRHDDSCPWYPTLARTGADQSHDHHPNQAQPPPDPVFSRLGPLYG